MSISDRSSYTTRCETENLSTTRSGKMLECKTSGGEVIERKSSSLMLIIDEFFFPPAPKNCRLCRAACAWLTLHSLVGWLVNTNGMCTATFFLISSLLDSMVRRALSSAYCDTLLKVSRYAKRLLIFPHFTVLRV